MTTESGQQMALHESLSRTAEKYDTLPYVSKPFQQTHPARMAAMAHMFGLDYPPIETARVLELGCAAGGNLIPIAATYPQSRCVGIDLGRKQVEEGQQRVAHAGLTNVEIRHESITEFPHDAGEFDYIVCHGVFSWVPDVVRTAILDICQRHLSPRGIAYISFNVSPGWRQFQPLRDAFRLMIPAHHDDATRVKMARRLMQLMKDLSPDQGPYGQMLRAAPDRLASSGDDYLFHEYMEDENTPFAISEFLNLTASHNLAFLGDSDIETMLPQNYGADFAQKLQSQITGDLSSYEQMFDVLTGRTFRRALLVRAERAAEIKRSLSPDRIEALHFMPSKAMKLERIDGGVRLVVEKGRALQSSDRPVGPSLERMLDKFPGSASFEHCVAGLGGEDRIAARNAFYRLVIAGLVDYAITPMDAVKTTRAPRATRLARADAAAGTAMTANLKHEGVMLDPSAMVLLPHLDGESNRLKLENVLFDAAQAGTITIRYNGVPCTEPRPLRDAIRGMLPQILDGIAASGLFEA